MTLDEWIEWLSARIRQAREAGAGMDDEVVTLRVRRSPRVGRLVSERDGWMVYAFTLQDLWVLHHRAQRRKFAQEIAREMAA